MIVEYPGVLCRGDGTGKRRRTVTSVPFRVTSRLGRRRSTTLHRFCGRFSWFASQGDALNQNIAFVGPGDRQLEQQLRARGYSVLAWAERDLRARTHLPAADFVIVDVRDQAQPAGLAGGVPDAEPGRARAAAHVRARPGSDARGDARRRQGVPAAPGGRRGTGRRARPHGRCARRRADGRGVRVPRSQGRRGHDDGGGQRGHRIRAPQQGQRPDGGSPPGLRRRRRLPRRRSRSSPSPTRWRTRTGSTPRF